MDVYYHTSYAASCTEDSHVSISCEVVVTLSGEITLALQVMAFSVASQTTLFPNSIKAGDGLPGLSMFHPFGLQPGGPMPRDMVCENSDCVANHFVIDAIRDTRSRVDSLRSVKAQVFMLRL